MLDKLIAEHKDRLLENLVSQVGLGKDEAGGFLSKIIGSIQGLIGGGKLDLKDLIGGNVGAITSKLDMNDLAGALGGSKDKAEQGVNAVVSQLSGILGEKSDIAESLLGKVGGGDLGSKLDAAKGIAGKLFGR